MDIYSEGVQLSVAAMKPSRRGFLTAGLVFLSGCSRFGLESDNNASSVAFGEQLGFETYDIGAVPPRFVIVGSGSQEVVASTAASGEQSYKMQGNHGECWMAMARFPLSADFRPSDIGVIEGAYRVKGGEEGCHSGSGKIKLITAASTEEFGPERETLLQFHPNGKVTTMDTEVGTFDPDDWVTFDIEYARNSERGEVIYKCRIGSNERYSVTRPERVYENDLSAIELTSGDYTVFWDDLAIRKM